MTLLAFAGGGGGCELLLFSFFFSSSASSPLNVDFVDFLSSSLRYFAVERRNALIQNLSALSHISTLFFFQVGAVAEAVVCFFIFLCSSFSVWLSSALLPHLQWVPYYIGHDVHITASGSKSQGPSWTEKFSATAGGGG